MPRAKKTTAPKTAPVEVKKETAVETKVEAPVVKEAPAAVVEAPKAAPKKAAAPVEIVHVQFGGNEWTVSELVEKAKAAYAAAGGDLSAVKELQLYVKPEENKAYYVVNGNADGSSIDL